MSICRYVRFRGKLTLQGCCIKSYIISTSRVRISHSFARFSLRLGICPALLYIKSYNSCFNLYYIKSFLIWSYLIWYSPWHLLCLPVCQINRRGLKWGEGHCQGWGLTPQWNCRPLFIHGLPISLQALEYMCQERPGISQDRRAQQGDLGHPIFYMYLEFWRNSWGLGRDSTGAYAAISRLPAEEGQVQARGS